MNRLIALAALGAVALIHGLDAQANDCKFGADRSATLPATGAKRLVLGAGPGELTVRGVEGLANVEATGRACAPTEEILGQVKLETRQEGTTLYLKTVFPEPGMHFNDSPRLDLTVRVPKSLALSLEDSSGDLEVSDVQSATIGDSSGDQTIRNVAGDLDVTDSSGEIEIDQVGGNLKLKDSSGDVEIEDIKGNIEVTVDSSGDLEIERVAGGVHIVNDSSGEITIRQVQRDVVIDVDSSGDIRVDDVGGRLEVGADASGEIKYAHVLGAVKIPEKD